MSQRGANGSSSGGGSGGGSGGRQVLQPQWQSNGSGSGGGSNISSSGGRGPDHEQQQQQQQQHKHGQPGKQQQQPTWQANAHSSSNSVLPTLPWQGRVVYAVTAREVDAACGQLLAAGPPGAVGYDLEWKPSFVKGAPPRKAALLQLAYQTQVRCVAPRPLCVAVAACGSSLH
jgi:hypothetical protein